MPKSYKTYSGYTQDDPNKPSFIKEQERAATNGMYTGEKSSGGYLNTSNKKADTGYTTPGLTAKINSGMGARTPLPLAGKTNPSYTFDGYKKIPTSTSGSYGASGVGYASGSGIGGNANFQASEAYNQAMNYTNQLLSQLNTGKTSYTDQINSLMDSINNRASFAYDPDTDPLFQQYLASSMESGKTAMMDSMAQASALTGGYGSTYAQGVGNAAYNNFVQDAYDNLPEYYQTALDAYNSETNNLYNKLNMYNVADATEYGRLADAYQNNLNMSNDMYGKEYSNYWDALNYDTDIAKYNADQAYRYASLAQDNAQFNAKMAYQREQDALAQQNYENEQRYQRDQDALALMNSANGSAIDNSPVRLDSYATDLLDRALKYNAPDSDEVITIMQQLEEEGYSPNYIDNYVLSGASSAPKNYSTAQTQIYSAFNNGGQGAARSVVNTLVDQGFDEQTLKEYLNSLMNDRNSRF